MAVNILDQVRNFLTAPKLDEALGALAHNPPTPPIRTSWVWDSHITESAGGGGKGKLPQSVSLSWDENEARGIESSMRSWQGLTPRERKEILLAIYLANPWVSACADVIATRICSGGFTVEKVSEETEDNNEHHDQLMNFCLRVNDDWDFLQYARASILDELIFGETYTEIVWQKGVPFQLYKVDCVTMGYKVARTGQIIRYEQQLTSTSEKNFLDPKDIIRWWFPHPHAAADPFSPIEKVQDAVNLDKKMVNWVTTFFQKGAKFPYYVKFPGGQDEAVRYIAYFQENHTGAKNAHVPPVAYDGAELVEFKGGSLDIDFPGGRDRNRTEVLSAYHVPPAPVGIIESGNIGGGTGEDQDKSLQYNACDPVKHAYLEKLNYRVSKRGFNIHDYRIGLRYADYRNDESLATVQDKHIRNGSITINEARQEMGKPPYKDGGDVGIVVASKDVFPVPRITDMEDEQKQSAQLDIEAKQVANEKAKNPPEPTMLPGQQGANNAKNTQGAPAKNKPTQKATGKPKTQESQTEMDANREGAFLARDGQVNLSDVSDHSRRSNEAIHLPNASKLEEQLDMTPEQLANFFHDTYERLAPDFSYQTRKSSAVAWKDVPENNKNLMIAVAGEVLKKLDKEQHEETTQPPAHQQSHARLTLLTQATDTQESATEAGEVRGATTEADTQQSDRDKLAYALAAIFLAVQSGQFTTDEQNYMVNLLEGAYMVARSTAYNTAFQAIGSDATWEPALADVDTARQWAQEQVASITSTFEESLAGLRHADPTITPDEIAGAVERYASWKAPQIANVTLGAGADAGTRQAVNDMLEELTSDEIDTSLIPDGLSAESIRLRVVPDSSSSDFCSEYAGKTYALDEEGDIPVWPAHPGCIHSLEVYVVVGGTDEPTE